MILSISIDVDKLISIDNEDYHFLIENITNTNIQWTNGGSGTVTEFEITVTNAVVVTDTSFSLGYMATLEDMQNAQLYEDDGGNVVIDDHIITMTGDVNLEYSDIMYMLKKGILRIEGKPDNTLIFAFFLNSERNVINKSLVLVDIITGYFRNTVNIKNPTITLQDYAIKNTFNYVYIWALNRYYYVQSVEVTTKNMVTLALAEDVLMSHKDLILSQTAFIERQENDYDDNLVDPLVTMKYDKNIVYTEVSYTTNIFNQVSILPPTRSTGDFVITVVNNQD